MLGNAIKLLRARKNPQAAKTLATEMLKEEVKAKTDGAIFALKFIYIGLIVLFILIAALSAYGGIKLSGLFYILTGLSCFALFVLFKAFSAAKARILEAQQSAEHLREKLPEMLRKQDQHKNEV